MSREHAVTDDTPAATGRHDSAQVAGPQAWLRAAWAVLACGVATSGCWSSAVPVRNVRYEVIEPRREQELETIEEKAEIEALDLDGSMRVTLRKEGRCAVRHVPQFRRVTEEGFSKKNEVGAIIVGSLLVAAGSVVGTSILATDDKGEAFVAALASYGAGALGFIPLIRGIYHASKPGITVTRDPAQDGVPPRVPPSGAGDPPAVEVRLPGAARGEPLIVDHVDCQSGPNVGVKVALRLSDTDTSTLVDLGSTNGEGRVTFNLKTQLLEFAPGFPKRVPRLAAAAEVVRVSNPGTVLVATDLALFPALRYGEHLAHIAALERAERERQERALQARWQSVSRSSEADLAAFVKSCGATTIAACTDANARLRAVRAHRATLSCAKQTLSAHACAAVVEKLLKEAGAKAPATLAGGACTVALDAIAGKRTNGGDLVVDGILAYVGEQADGLLKVFAKAVAADRQRAEFEKCVRKESSP